MTDEKLPRRRFLAGAGAAAAGTAAVSAFTLPAAEVARGATAARPAPAPAPAAPAAAVASPASEPLLTLTPTEAAFITAAVDTFIPADELTPSGSQCGVATFIDRQLAGSWGDGGRFYSAGPFRRGKPEQGYQLALTPREFFRAGIAAANAWSVTTYGKEFDRLSSGDREAALKTMEANKAQFADFPSKMFFEQLLQITMEGYFSDPMYGGNRDKVSWKMLGYPGLPATYADKAEAYRGKKLDLPPQSIADFS
jgi:gluconate 2-dehydrogenase gamma chain